MGRKDFNKGMEAGARPFEEKFRHMGQEFKDFSGKMEEDVDDIKRTNEAILDEMDSMQKKQFYRDNTAVDIAVLEKGDRETLLSILFTLTETEENVNKYQQLFIRSVRKYLENEEDSRKPKNWSVLKDGSWSIIETIIGIEETKAIAQAVMEFLFLGYGNHEAYFEEYEDLFDYFCLNRKGFGEIRAHIDNIYRATGLEGIAENYGYVPEKEETEESAGNEKDITDKYGARGKLTQLKITDEIIIGAGQKKIFENSKIIFANKIKLCDGAKLCFRNCEICFDAYSFGQNVELSHSSTNCCVQLEGKNCSVDFDSCTFERMNYHINRSFPLDSKDLDYFLFGGTGSKLTVENCHFEGCHSLFYGTSALIKGSRVNWIEENGRRSFLTGDNIKISNTIICENEKYTDFYNVLFEAAQYLHIDNCHFNNCFHLKFEMIDTAINDSDFVNCVIGEPNKDIPYGGKKGKIQFKNCQFQECVFKGDSWDKSGGMRFEKSEFISCMGQLYTDYIDEIFADGGFLWIRTEIAVEMNKCKFTNGSFDVSDDIRVYQENYHEAFCVGNGSRFLGCSFENMTLGKMSLIGGSAREPMASCSIENCIFTNISTTSGQLINRQYKYYKEGIFTSKLMGGRFEVSLQNCTGL